MRPRPPRWVNLGLPSELFARFQIPVPPRPPDCQSLLRRSRHCRTSDVAQVPWAFYLHSRNTGDIISRRSCRINKTPTRRAQDLSPTHTEKRTQFKLESASSLWWSVCSEIWGIYEIWRSGEVDKRFSFSCSSVTKRTATGKVQAAKLKRKI